jgi:putative transcriptional regulator
MDLLKLVHGGIIAAALSMPATMVGAALQAPTENPRTDSLAGQLLVASPSIMDPRFFHAVILMVRHDRNGAFGIVINRPVGERPWSSLLDAVGESGSGATGTVRVFAGGPVEPQSGFVVHSAEYRRAQTIDIDGRVAVTSSHEILHDIGNGQGPKQSLLAFGYAGWRPGQLEDELRQGAWFTASQDPQLIFEEDRDKVWDDAMSRRTQDL